MAGTTQSAGPTQKDEAKLEVIMARLLNPLAELPLKLLAMGINTDRNVTPQFPGFRPHAAPSGTASPLVQATGLPRALANTDGWHHGGINE
jgi:hypothetical protein